MDFVHLGIHPHYSGGNSEGDAIDPCIYEPGGNISVGFMQGSGDGARRMGGFEEASVKFAEDMSSAAKPPDLAGIPDRVMISVGGQIVANRDLACSDKAA